jgi:uncharacterized protein YbbK (DUF523 family)
VYEDDTLTLRRSSDGANVMDLIVDQTQKMMDAYSDVPCAILKSKSPSCGYGTTPIYNPKGKEIAKGNGVAASLMKKNFYTIHDENNYQTLKES